MIKYHLITYGCQMNKSDSERIVSVLEKSGLKPTTQDRADILILNLCSVRQSAIDRVWGILRKTKNQTVILTGCILPADKQKFQNKVDLILDIKDLPRWPEKFKIKNSIPDRIGDEIKNFPEVHPDYFSINPDHSSKFEAYVPIMTGCNNFCAYCAVPYTRGREVSRPVEDIIQEVHTLIIQGYKLIILLGQNVNSYKSKISNFSLFERSLAEGQFLISNKISNFKFQISKNTSVNFPTLLKLISRIPGDYWLSFLTSHPKDLSDELINCFKECEHLIPYLHLPLQSGSNKILKAMNRNYTATDYVKLIKQVKQIKPMVAVSTDIIVGFPSETKKEFEATAKLMKKIKFDMAYLAQYSPRPGTAAAKLKDNVLATEKARRRSALNEILKKTALNNNKKMVGKRIEVLIEKCNNKNECLGKTKNFKDVKINVAPAFRQEKIRPKGRSYTIKKDLIGQFAKVKITKANAWSLEGKLII